VKNQRTSLSAFAPSLEIVGETNQGNIELAVRIRFAPRVTDKHGIIGVTIS